MTDREAVMILNCLQRKSSRMWALHVTPGMCLTTSPLRPRELEAKAFRGQRVGWVRIRVSVSVKVRF